MVCRDDTLVFRLRNIMFVWSLFFVFVSRSFTVEGRIYIYICVQFQNNTFSLTPFFFLWLAFRGFLFDIERWFVAKKERKRKMLVSDIIVSARITGIAIC